MSTLRPTGKPPSRLHPKIGWGLLAGLLVIALAVIFTMSTQVESTRAEEALGVDLAPTVFNEPTYSSPITLSANNQHVWVVNPDDDSVSVIGWGR